MIEWPVTGEWRAVKSPGHHRFTYDLMAVSGGRLQRKSLWEHLRGRVQVDDVYSWSRPLRSPVTGTVATVRDGWPDRTRLNLLTDVVGAFTSGTT